MREKIRKTMEDMLMKNCKCDYTFVRSYGKFHEKNMSALDAYTLAYKLSKLGDIECFMSPNGTQAVKPIFAVKTGIIILNGQVVDIDDTTPTPKEIYCAILAESVALDRGTKMTTTYTRAEKDWDENPNRCIALLKRCNLI